eukprot:101120-Pyramimonas_sp.AAC.1
MSCFVIRGPRGPGPFASLAWRLAAVLHTGSALSGPRGPTTGPRGPARGPARTVGTSSNTRASSLTSRCTAPTW